MDPPSSSQTATAPAADEWELCNDDGFIYKRAKRQCILTEPATSPADHEEGEVRRREWKRKNLLRVKEKYEKEIKEWEVLSDSLKTTQMKALGFHNQQQERRKLKEAEEERMASFPGSEKEESASSSLVDELLLLVEAQEMIIRDVTNLCDIAEAMCNAQEERTKQSYFDLPIWASPCDLMAALCDE